MKNNGKFIERDYLTGLANRHGLYQYYDGIDKDTVLHAMYIDVDNFKHINDIYGHSVGDSLLVEIGRLVLSFADGFVSRIGGDEFVVLMDGDLSIDKVEEMAQSLIDNMYEMDYRKDIISLISLSIGIVLSQQATCRLDDILAKCDAAMYQAKYDGRNLYRIYHSVDKILENNRTIENEMKEALLTGQFKVYLQPKVNMVTSKITGAEALSRWEHPVDGIRPPDYYIPLFEKNGFISKLDLYVYEEVCKLKAAWAEENRSYAHIPISVNMSRYHLYNPKFPDTLEEIAHKYNVSTSELELELTENTFIKDNTEMIKVISRLQDKGFMVSIDDFGSGYSALNMLKDLSVDTVKIDKEFLQDSSDNERGRKVIRNVIAMCLDLKIDVVTEGIETQEQIDLVTKCGCQTAQGFFYSKPIPVKDFMIFAEDHMSKVRSNFTFRLDGNITSEDGECKAVNIGFEPEFHQGIFKEAKAIYFPGGDVENNVLELPPEILVNDSYTISMWIKPERLHSWTAALYIKFESGFLAIIPLAWDVYSNVRIRDSREVDGWHDVQAMPLQEGIWYNYAIVYNSKTETAYSFINGDVAGVMENVPANRYAKRIMVGGDVFQQSFQGEICEVIIYNEAKDFNFMKNMHESYITSNKYVGGPLKKIF